METIFESPSLDHFLWDIYIFEQKIVERVKTHDRHEVVIEWCHTNNYGVVPNSIRFDLVGSEV